MAANNRNDPQRQASSSSDYSLMEFMREFPDDAACLDRLWRERFAPDGHTADCPRCERPRRFHRTKTRASYTCDTCGLHVHPMKGTIFEKSTTSLHLWFYAMYLMASTRCGISAKQLEREIGVTYKTAHRMMKKIRTELMNDEDDGPLGGDVEIDETSVRGKPRVKMTRSEAAIWREAQPKVLGMVERGGRVRLRVIPSRRGPALSRAVRANVNPSSIIFTDDWQAYKPLRREYIDHRIINHSAGIYVDGTTHTNTIEGFFGNLKTGMRGAYKKVSPRYLQSYLNEYAWRYNARYDGRAMFVQLVARAAAS
ncbi:MAG: transposase [Solirubrobacteraceae bacterium]|jgi:transposase-like protein|nr:transposase [Solirubrobacteraceae bacterium]